MSVELVLRAVDATLARSTARLRMRLEANLLGHEVASAGSGVLDLGNGRHHITDGDHPQLVDRSRRYTPLEDGTWKVPMKQLPPGLPAPGTPHWLLDLLRGTVRAEPAGGERLDGVDAVALRCTTDLVEADARAPGGICTAPAASLRELRAKEVEVWIGPDELIRRIRVRMPGSLQMFELSDFDVPAPIELPPDELVVEALPEGWM